MTKSNPIQKLTVNLNPLNPDLMENPRTFMRCTYHTTWDVFRTLHILVWIMRVLVCIVCCFSVHGLDILDIAEQLSLLAVYHIDVHLAVRRRNVSTNLVAHYIFSTSTLFLNIRTEINPWITVLYTLHPYFGFFGTIFGSILVLGLLETVDAKIHWFILLVFAYLVVPLLRYIMHKKFVIRIYQWDQCLPSL